MNQGTEKDRNLGPRQGPTLLRNSDPNLQVSRALGLVRTCAKEMFDTCPLRETRQNHRKNPVLNTPGRKGRGQMGADSVERGQSCGTLQKMDWKNTVTNWRGRREAEKNQFQARVAGT